MNEEIPFIFLNYIEKGNISFELSILKDELFVIKIHEAVATGYNWKFINENSFLNTYIESTTIPEKSNNKTTDYNNNDKEINFTHKTTTIQEHVFKGPYLGGSKTYYHYFKALKKTEEPIILNYIYSTYENSEIRVNATIKIWIFDEFYTDKCINNYKKCIYNEENKNCISKILCRNKEISPEISCNESNESIILSPSMTKCIFAENEQKCILKNLCTSSLSKEICNSSFTLNPNITKCAYNDDINECEIKELCDIEENPSLNKCNEIPTTNSYEEKCIYDEKKGKCIRKKICLNVESPSIETCQESLTSDKKLKCIFDENNNKCVE